MGAAGLLCVTLIVWFWPPTHRLLFGPGSPPNQIVVSGNIEAHESVLSFTYVQAPITRLPFDEGKAVAAGTVLAQVDAAMYRKQLRIDAANRDVALRQVAVARSDWAAARSTVVSDTLDMAQKRRDLIRATGQLRIGAASRQTYDLARTAAGQSAAALARDRALLRVAGTQVGLALANVQATQARVALDRVILGYTTLRAPFSGVLAVREADLGELAGPGVAIFTLDDLDHIWLRAYVNEQDLGKIRLGESAEVTTDTYPGHPFTGHISFIASQAEFTPKTVQTHAERVTLVYRIRIDINNPTHALLPGMPADAHIVLLHAPQ
ncbi:MAG: HlyD family secretion protein [Steroidobacteraceae bacterium]